MLVSQMSFNYKHKQFIAMSKQNAGKHHSRLIIEMAFDATPCLLGIVGS